MLFGRDARTETIYNNTARTVTGVRRGCRDDYSRGDLRPETFRFGIFELTADAESIETRVLWKPTRHDVVMYVTHTHQTPYYCANALRRRKANNVFRRESRPERRASAVRTPDTRYAISYRYVRVSPHECIGVFTFFFF